MKYLDTYKMFEKASKITTYKGSDGKEKTQKDWSHLKGAYTMNNGILGWVDDNGTLYNLKISDDKEQAKKLVDEFQEKGYVMDKTIPCIG